MAFLGFSAEATSPAGYLLMELIKPIRRNFNECFASKKYSTDLDELFIVFICMSQKMGGYKDRKYISRKNRYADIRLNMDFDQFLLCDSKKRWLMMWALIQVAIDIVSERVSDFKRDELIEDIKYCIKKAYPEIDDENA